MGERHNAEHVHRTAKRWSDQQKAPVFGMVERGRVVVRAYVVPSTQGPTLYTHIPVGEARNDGLHRYDARVYRKTLPMHGFEHHRINHSENVYVSGDMHTQNIEAASGPRSSVDQRRAPLVSVKYLQSYVDEYVWRFTHRADHTTGRGMFFTLARSAATKTV